jgi:hypothetical protein
LHDALDDDGVARLARSTRDDDVVADAKAGVGGEARVYSHTACALLRRSGAEGDEEKKESESEVHGDAV